MSTNGPDKALAVIVRFHNPARAFELRRAVFSLLGQYYRPLTILLVTQRFTGEQLRLLREELTPTLSLDESVTLRIENYDKDGPRDARSALISLGMRAAAERYLALLDHDDVILPGAYTILIDELCKSGTAIAFGSVAAKEVDIFHDAVLVEKRREIFRGQGLTDLLRENFCPIHSFVADRGKIDPKDLWFDDTLCKGEDYEFLLRICAKYPASFELRGTFVGDYYFKNDWSNTIGVPEQMTAEGLVDWDRSNKYLERRKEEIVLSPLVQRALGLRPADPSMTIRHFLNKVDASEIRDQNNRTNRE